MHIKALKDLRKAAGLTLEDIAREVGATRQTVSKWELGLCWPSAAVMPRLATLLSCSLEDLYAGEGAGSEKDPGGASPSPTNDHNMEGTA